MDPNNEYRDTEDATLMSEALDHLVRDVESGNVDSLLDDVERFAPGWIVHRSKNYSDELTRPPFNFQKKWMGLCQKIQQDLSKEREQLLKENPDATLPRISVLPREILIVRRSPVEHKDDEKLMRWVCEALTTSGFQVRNVNEFTVCKATNKVIFSEEFTRIYLNRKFDGYAKEYKGMRRK